jgi:Fibronectin type III domain
VADPLISLDTEHISAQPGGEARVIATVKNPGRRVEGYTIHVLGPLAPYSKVIPPEVSVYTGDEKMARVEISPPTAPAVPSGLHPFAVIARSTIDPNASAVAEGTIEIGQVFDLQAKIIPVNSSGRWRGRHVMQISNWGNAPAQLQVEAFDQDNEIGFYLNPKSLDLPPGRTATVRVLARARHPSLRAGPVQRPFQAVVEQRAGEAAPPPAAAAGFGDPSRQVVPAFLTQKPILSKGLITILALLLVGIIALITYLLLWRPDIQNMELAPRGSPPKPKLTVTSTGPDSVGLAWRPIDQVERYNLLHVDCKTNNVTKPEALDAAQNAYIVTGLKPDSEVCFRLSATRAALTGPQSDTVRTRTTRPPPSPSPTQSSTPSPTQSSTLSPTPSPTPTTLSPSPSPSSSSPTPTSSFSPGDENDPIMKQHWIAVAEVLPASTNDAANAQQKMTELSKKLADVKYLNTRDYPRLLLDSTTPPTPPTEELFLVYVGGAFNTQDEAEKRCAIVRKHTGNCIAAIPDP